MTSVSDCLFCKIARGFEPAHRIADDGVFLAFRDIFPRAETHVLIVPRDHHTDLDSYMKAGCSASDMMTFVTGVARDVGVEGRYRLLTNIGRSAGRMIHHLHWHMLAGEGLGSF